MKQAICLLAAAGAGRFLAVSRRNDITRWGLPGGKVDPGESSAQALVREVFEETALKDLDVTQLVPLYSGVCPGKGPDDTYWVTTYYLPGDVELDNLLPEAGLEVRALCERVLTDARSCPFAAYNVEVFRALRLYQSV